MEPSIGVAIMLGWILETPRCLQVDYWKEQGIQASYRADLQVWWSAAGRVMDLGQLPYMGLCVRQL